MGLPGGDCITLRLWLDGEAIFGSVWESKELLLIELSRSWDESPQGIIADILVIFDAAAGSFKWLSGEDILKIGISVIVLKSVLPLLEIVKYQIPYRYNSKLNCKIM